MQTISIERIAAAAWISAVGIVGLAGDVGSASTWLLLTGVAVLPPVVMMWQWNEPSESMSQRIHRAQR
jgi:hypothetical protein